MHFGCGCSLGIQVCRCVSRFIFPTILKPAVTIIFILTIEQMSKCTVKSVTCTNKPTDNYHLTLPLPSAPQSF